MNNVNISIIIPCYNSARFISATLDMLVFQGLGGCEVIVVNDGSTDGTAQIVRGYAERHPEITLIDKQNEGISVARTAGMDTAKREYIYFLDSDDTLEEGTLDFFRKTLAENPGKEFFAFGYYTLVNGKLRKDYSARRYACMVLDAAISLHTYRFLLKGKWKGAYFASLVACGFHFSAMILFPICIMYRIYRSGKLKFSFFLFLFFMVFVLGLAFAKVMPQIMKLFSSMYLAYGNEEGAT